MNNSDSKNSPQYLAEVGLVALLLQHPDKAILDTLYLDPTHLTKTKYGTQLFKRITQMIHQKKFDLNQLGKEFGDSVVEKYLQYEVNIDTLPALISYIKAGVDLSQYHIRNQLAYYKDKIAEESKLPLSERVLKPHLIDVQRAIGGYYRGELSVLAATPGQGKSSLALQEAVDFGTKKRPTVYIIHEMTERRQIDRMIAAEADNLLFQELIELTYMNDPVKQKDWLRTFANLHKNEIYIVGSNKETDYANWKNLRQLILNFIKLGVIFFEIDSINLMYWSEVNMKRNYELEAIIRDILAICTSKDYNNPHIRLIAHVNREVEKTADKRPRLNHLGDTSGLSKWVDLAQFIYRDAESDDPNIAEIYALKNRNAVVPSIARVFWDGPKFRFRNLQHGGIL